MFSMVRKLRGVFKENERDAGVVLRKFWKSYHRMHALQENVVSWMIYFIPKGNLSHCQKRGQSNRPDGVSRRQGLDEDAGLASKEKRRQCFKRARWGDDLMVQFEYDWCLFTQLKNKLPDPTITTDILLMSCIRRATLDAFWSRAGSTVNGQATLVQKGIALSKLVGLESLDLEPRPLPAFDYCGYGGAIQLLLKSQEAEKYQSSHQQWDTVHGMSVAYRNQVRASGVANSSTLSVGESDGEKYLRICEDPSCSSLWYSRFSARCKRRMGQDCGARTEPSPRK